MMSFKSITLLLHFGMTVSTEPVVLSRDRPTPMSNLWTQSRVWGVGACMSDNDENEDMGLQSMHCIRGV